MLPHIALRVYGAPLLMHPQKAEAIAWALHQRMGPGYEASEPGPEPSRFMGSRRRKSGDFSLARAHKGVGLVTIEGSLVNRGAWLDSRSGLTSYEGIAAQLADIEGDPEIKSVVLDLDTPGGEAGGVFLLADRIRALRAKKRVVAVVNDTAASAGFALASAADEIVVSSTSMVGSIGVVVLHLDRSGELAQKGIKATLVFAGAHKVDVNPFGPLTEAGAGELKQLVQTFYDRFVEAVGAGRGAKLTAEMARATEARVFIGESAVKAGLADRVGTIETVLAELSNSPVRPSGYNPRPAAALSADLSRVIAITALPEARGHQEQAAALAAAGVSVEGARKALVLLAAAEKEEERRRISDSWRRASARADLNGVH